MPHQAHLLWGTICRLSSISRPHNYSLGPCPSQGLWTLSRMNNTKSRNTLFRKVKGKCVVDKFKQWNQIVYSWSLRSFTSIAQFLYLNKTAVGCPGEWSKIPHNNLLNTIMNSPHTHADSPNYSVLLYCILYFIYLCCIFPFQASIRPSTWISLLFVLLENCCVLCRASLSESIKLLIWIDKKTDIWSSANPSKYCFIILFYVILLPIGFCGCSS